MAINPIVRIHKDLATLLDELAKKANESKTQVSRDLARHYKREKFKILEERKKDDYDLFS